LALALALGILGAGGADRCLPGQRAAQLGDLLVEVLAGLVGERREQPGALGPLAGRRERLAEGIAERDRARVHRAALLQRLDRGVELALRDHAVGGAQPGALARTLGGGRE